MEDINNMQRLAERERDKTIRKQMFLKIGDETASMNQLLHEQNFVKFTMLVMDIV